MDPNDLQAKAKEQARKAREAAEKQAKWASEQAKKVADKVKEEVRCCSTPALASMRVPTDAGTSTSMHRFTPTAMHAHTFCRVVHDAGVELPLCYSVLVLAYHVVLCWAGHHSCCAKSCLHSYLPSCVCRPRIFRPRRTAFLRQRRAHNGKRSSAQSPSWPP
jgi:hypothetical protein